MTSKADMFCWLKNFFLLNSFQNEIENSPIAHLQQSKLEFQVSFAHQLWRSTFFNFFQLYTSQHNTARWSKRSRRVIENRTRMRSSRSIPRHTAARNYYYLYFTSLKPSFAWLWLIPTKTLYSFIFSEWHWLSYIIMKSVEETKKNENRVNKQQRRTLEIVFPFICSFRATSYVQRCCCDCSILDTRSWRLRRCRFSSPRGLCIWRRLSLGRYFQLFRYTASGGVTGGIFSSSSSRIQHQHRYNGIFMMRTRRMKNTKINKCFCCWSSRYGYFEGSRVERKGKWNYNHFLLFSPATHRKKYNEIFNFYRYRAMKYLRYFEFWINRKLEFSFSNGLNDPSQSPSAPPLESTSSNSRRPVSSRSLKLKIVWLCSRNECRWRSSIVPRCCGGSHILWHLMSWRPFLLSSVSKRSRLVWEKEWVKDFYPKKIKAEKYT